MTGYATHAPGTMAKAQMTGGSRRQRGIILRWTGVRATYEVDKAMGDARVEVDSGSGVTSSRS